MRYFMLIYCWFLLSLVDAWNLATSDDTGLNFLTDNNEFEIVHVSVFYVRSFLTIRSRRNTTNSQISIIESTWPENLLPIQSRVFPNGLSHAKTPSNCNGIVKTIQTAVDRTNGLLWLLDNGSKYCTPKLIVFDLLRGNNEVHRYVFKKLKSGSFKSIQLYAREASESVDNAIIQMNPMAKTCALILLHKSKYLIQYSLLEDHPRKLSLIIKTRSTHRSYDILIPAEITLKDDDELLVKDYSNGLWLASLKQIQRSLREEAIDYFVEVKYLGSLLGSSKALTIPTVGDDDNNHYLYYYLPRDGAVVRWNFRLPLRAEGHEVLFLAKTPVIQIIFGAKGSVWIVYENADEMGDHCRRILNFPTFNMPRLIQ